MIDIRNIFHPVLIIIALLPLLVSCSRTAALEKKKENILAEYNRLNDCEQIQFIRKYLTARREYESYLGVYWPTNDVMSYMLGEMILKTGVALNTGQGLGGYAWEPGKWLKLMRPWSSILGCDGVPADRMNMLRNYDSLLMQAYEAVTTHSWLKEVTGPGDTTGLRFTSNYLSLSESCMIGKGLLERSNMPQLKNGGNVMDSLTGHFENVILCDKAAWPYKPYLYGRPTYIGLLPDDPEPDYYLYFGWLDTNIIVATAVSRKGAERLHVKPYRNRSGYEEALFHTEWERNPFSPSMGLKFMLQWKPDGSRAMMVSAR